ncbi:hypothetical protein BsWGS_21015 [Bradybaena similaris]
MYKILAVLVLASVAYCQIPQPCFSPPLLSFFAIQYNQEFTTFRNFDAAYDNQGERFAFFEREETGPQPGRQYYHIIILHRENIAYEYNRNTKVCRKSQAGPFRPFGVPPNGRFEGQYYIGGPGETVEAVEWSDRSDVRREEWIGVFSRVNCYPIRTWLHSNISNQTIHTHIYNLVTGITDPNIFLPPAACLNATLNEPTDLGKDLMSMYNSKRHGH